MVSSPKTQTTISKTELPKWVDDAAQKNLAIADQLAERPYVPYTGQITPGLSPMQQAANANALNSAGSWQQGLNASTALTTGNLNTALQQTQGAGQLGLSGLTNFLNSMNGAASGTAAAGQLAGSQLGNALSGTNAAIAGTNSAITGTNAASAAASAGLPAALQSMGGASQSAMDGLSALLASMGGAQNLTTGGLGAASQGIGTASDITQGVAGYTPDQVQARSFLSGNVQDYMNPYIENVETRAIDNLNRNLQTNLNTESARAVSSGAFGGSRQGIMEGVAQAETARAAGDLSAQLRADAFNTASGLMTADNNRALQADLANQSTGLAGQQLRLGAAGQLGDLSALNQQLRQAAGAQVGQLASQQQGLVNDTAGLRANIAAQQQGLQQSAAGLQGQLAGQAGQLAGQTGALAAQQQGLAANAAALQGQLAGQGAQIAGQRQGMLNDSASLQAALAAQLQQLGMGAGAQVAQNAQAGAQLANQDTAMLAGLGEQERAVMQQQMQEQYAKWKEAQDYPMQQLNLRLAALGAVPYGSTNSQTGPAQSSGSPALSIFGSVLSALPLLAGLSDKNEKTDIKRVGTDKQTGLPLYSFRYKGDPKTYPKVVGPMAQDIEKKFPGQVKDVAGRKAVNLGFGPMAASFRG